MISIRKSSDRGHFDHGWLNTYHTFSFGSYHDPRQMGFRALRVINEDVVAPGKGFGQHPHDNMEIITYIMSGSLAHRDTLGHTQAITPGDVQHMSAGTGLEHAEFNGSKTEPVHLLQIWLLPKSRNIKPAYGQTNFPVAERQGKLRLVASPDGAEGSLTINQDTRLYATLLSKGEAVTLLLAGGRYRWVQVARGSLSLNGNKLAAGDGAAISEESALKIVGESDDAEALVFDLA